MVIKNSSSSFSLQLRTLCSGLVLRYSGGWSSSTEEEEQEAEEKEARRAPVGGTASAQMWGGKARGPRRASRPVWRSTEAPPLSGTDRTARRRGRSEVGWGCGLPRAKQSHKNNMQLRRHPRPVLSVHCGNQSVALKQVGNCIEGEKENCSIQSQFNYFPLYTPIVRVETPASWQTILKGYTDAAKEPFSFFPQGKPQNITDTLPPKLPKCNMTI